VAAEPEPSRAEPSPKAKPAIETEPVQSEPVRPEPVQPEPVQPDPSEASESGPKPAVEADPEADPNPVVTSPTPTVQPADQESSQDVALSVAAAEGLYVRVPGQRRFQAFESGDLPQGAVLRSQRGGARVALPAGTLFLAQEGEVQWKEGLQLTRGQVLLEGRAVRVQSAQGAVDVRGRVLLEVRKGKLGVQVLAGEARWTRGEETRDMSTGDVLMTAAKGAPRVGRGQGSGPQAAPAWVRKLRVARRRAGRKGGPSAGGRGPRKSGGGPGGRRGGGRSR
jgi:hypothetical protein